MFIRLIVTLLSKALKGGERIMYAEFLTYRVINGKLKFAKIPESALKEEVRAKLIEEGREDLVAEAA